MGTWCMNCTIFTSMQIPATPFRIFRGMEITSDEKKTTLFPMRKFGSENYAENSSFSLSLSVFLVSLWMKIRAVGTEEGGLLHPRRHGLTRLRQEWGGNYERVTRNLPFRKRKSSNPPFLFPSLPLPLSRALLSLSLYFPVDKVLIAVCSFLSLSLSLPLHFLFRFSASLFASSSSSSSSSSASPSFRNELRDARPRHVASRRGSRNTVYRGEQEKVRKERDKF